MNDELKTLVQEMTWVRKLLMLQALAVGYKQKQLAATLGVSEATLSRMIPKSVSRPIQTAASGEASE
jgi:DNA-binding transcriptional regulator YdaS (Cro superfamily)